MSDRVPRVQRFMETHYASLRLCEASLRALWPMFQGPVRRGRYEISAPVKIDGAAVCDAIARATGRETRFISVSSSADHRAFIAPPYGGTPYENGLAPALMARHWAAIEEGLRARFGTTYARRKDELWNCLKSDVASPLDLPFWEDPEAAPRYGAGESVMTTLVYFAAAAVGGLGDVVGALEPLVRLLPTIVPVCVDPTRADAWIVALPPIARK
jgi:hypothetical protein